MNTIVFIIIFYETRAYYIPESDSPNVGTVIFAPSDLKKQHWSTANIELLEARKYFQSIIPSPHFINTINEQYLTNLLNYFEDSYSTVKREIQNPSLRKMMEVALSDAIGGYLKIWVLPITKYAYYGGTVPLDKALKTFEIYESIKRSLKTNGQGWRSPNQNLLNSVAINVVSLPHESFTRSMDEPCRSLAYYEKTDTGMTIPLPFISWGISPTTMFVPIKNQSIVLLSSPNASQILLKYYDIAENCMQSQNPGRNDFDQRFQQWLSNDVAPHLNDDKLYVAFGGVLGLMNVTKRFYEKISKACNVQFAYLKDRANSIRKPIHIYSKKFIIIAIILFIEIIWCIPTLILIIRTNKRRRRNKRRLYKAFNSKTIDNMGKFSKSHQGPDVENVISNDDASKNKKLRGVKLFLKPRTRNLEVDVQFPSHNSKYLMSNNSNKLLLKSNHCKEKITLVNELPLKSSLKKILPEFEVTSIFDKDLTNEKRSKPSDQITSKDVAKESGNITHDLEFSKTMTLIKDSEKTIKEITYSPADSLLINNSSSVSNCKCCTAVNLSTQGNNIIKKFKIGDMCPCTTCLKEGQFGNTNKIKSVSYDESKSQRQILKEKYKEAPRTVMRSRIEKEKKSQAEKRTNVEPKKAEVKNKKNNEQSQNHPLLRIRIERPPAAIKVGITSYKEQPKTLKKPSKIPRLAAKTRKEDIKINKLEEYIAGISNNNTKLSINNTTIRTTGLIIKGKALDDSVIKSDSITDKKLNVTL